MTKWIRTASFVSSAALAVSLLSACSNPFSAVKLDSYAKYDNAEEYLVGGVDNLQKDIAKIDLNWLDGTVTIATYDKDIITISETSDSELTEPEAVHFLVKNNVLYIQYAESSYSWEKAIPKKDLCVYLPKDVSLNEFSLKNVSADVNIDNLDTARLAIETVSGNINASLVDEVYECKAETVSGEITLAMDSVDKLMAETISGNLNLTLTEQEPNYMKAEMVSGDLNLTLPEKADFLASIESVSGKLTSEDFPCTETGHGDYTCGTASTVNYEIEAVSGNITIRKVS